MRLLIAGSVDGRVERALADHDTERARTAETVRERAPSVDAVVTADPDLSAAAERAAPATPVVAPDEPRLAAAVERAVEAGRYREAVDELYERARERARQGRDDPDPEFERARVAADEAFERARVAADEAFERARRTAGLTPYSALLDDERTADRED